MGKVLNVKTNFTAGQVSAHLYGRGDLVSYENGARRLENVIIRPTGGVSRRCGLRCVDQIPEAARLVPFEFNTEQAYLLAFLDHSLRVYRGDELVAELATPWGAEHLPGINWTQSADTMLVVHPDVAPRKIVRNAGEVWAVEEWSYYADDKGIVCCPYFNFYQKLLPLAYASSGGVNTLSSPEPIFTPAHVGSLVKIRGGLVRIDTLVDAQTACVQVLKAPTAGTALDWEENSFSDARGWPISVTFHQNRLVIGGSRSLPNRIWLSQSSDLFNFSLGTGLDDEGIEFAILSDQVNAVRAVVSGRHLQVFTTGAEWMVAGDPLAPGSIQLLRQTTIGSCAERNIPLQLVDGATVFVSRNGRQLREFLFADVEQAYLSSDLTLMSEDIVADPADMAFDSSRNVLYMVLADGTVSCLTNYRSEQVNAWSKLSTQGRFVSVCIRGSDACFCVKRGGEYFIEAFGEGFYADNAEKLESAGGAPKKLWTLPERFKGRRVTVVADGLFAGRRDIGEEGELELLREAGEIVVGLPYEHLIEPLPFVADVARPHSPKTYRVVSSVFRILEAHAMSVDVGRGYFDAPLFRFTKERASGEKRSFSGDLELGSIGWIRDMDKTMWSIRGDSPSPFTLLSVVSEIQVK